MPRWPPAAARAPSVLGVALMGLSPSPMWLLALALRWRRSGAAPWFPVLASRLLLGFASGQTRRSGLINVLAQFSLSKTNTRCCRCRVWKLPFCCGSDYLACWRITSGKRYNVMGRGTYEGRWGGGARTSIPVSCS
ncbi:hypothetical protein B0T24DRAFT_610914 [Lasiosphaeria ovina]|uniref:Uncharacterized protein n=1 Tax=Lasiosphaeria ovina TaxID=92902 RepID=A0AAE0KMX1_9PEZI|nr:hypothetical protein B0T24DRAFT_610914 [Lasiosphaeria ovina]